MDHARQVTETLEMQGCVEISNMGQIASRNGEEAGFHSVRHKIINKIRRSVSFSEASTHRNAAYDRRDEPREEPREELGDEQIARVTSRVASREISQLFVLSRLIREISMRVILGFLANKDGLTTEEINAGSRIDNRSLRSSGDRNFGEFISGLINHTLLLREIGLQMLHDMDGSFTFFRAFRFDAARTPRLHDNKIPVMILGLVRGSARPREARSWVMLQIVRYYDQEDPVLANIPNFVRRLADRVVDLSDLPYVLADDDMEENFETRIFRPEGFCLSKVESGLLQKCNHLLYVVRHKGEDNFSTKIVEEGETCPICLVDYVEGDLARELPFCNHWFHQNCIDEWLTKCSNTCPICRGCGLA